MKTTYQPKPVRGQTYLGYIRINRAQLCRLFNSDEGYLFTGFIVGNKVHAYHFFGGWCLAHACNGLDKGKMDITINSFLFYLDPELGNNVSIYLKA